MLKKYEFVLTLLLLVNVGWAQTFLTNGQVYNFDIGDTMRMSLWGPSVGSSAYVTDVVTGKSVSANGTTILYTIQSTTYNPPSPTSTGIYTKTITNLNAPASQDNNSEYCVQLHDTTFTNKCGYSVWKKLSTWQCESAQRDVTQEDTYLIEGLGGPYYSYVSTADNFVPAIYGYNLIFYSKASSQCNSRITSVQNISKDPDFVIYPNPSNGQFSIIHDGFEKLSIQLFDLNGKLVLEQSADTKISVDASQLNDGICTLKITKAGYSYNKKLVIVH